MNILHLKENPTSAGSVFQHASVPLWEFYELHKGKSIVQSLSSECTCLGDIHSVKQLFSYENHATAKMSWSFQITFLPCPPPKRTICQKSLKP